MKNKYVSIIFYSCMRHYKNKRLFLQRSVKIIFFQIFKNRKQIPNYFMHLSNRKKKLVLKSTFCHKKSNQNYFTKKFFCMSSFIIYPPFSLQRPMDVFISILRRRNFQRRHNQRRVKLELLSSLIALLVDKIWKSK